MGHRDVSREDATSWKASTSPKTSTLGNSCSHDCTGSGINTFMEIHWLIVGVVDRFIYTQEVDGSSTVSSITPLGRVIPNE